MRTLNELYLLLWEYIKDMEELDEGLCIYLHWIEVERIITTEEYMIIYRHFRDNKPKLNMNYFPFCFPNGETGTKQRKEFVLSMIEKTKQHGC